MASTAPADVAAELEVGGVESRAHRLDANPDADSRCAACIRMLRSRLFWAKFWLVATGVWWGVCMQLLFYEGAGHPLAMLPNLDWYIGMMLVYGGRLCTPRSAYTHYATIRQRHVLPIAVCDFLGTVGTTMGLELAGSAIFGIIYSSVTVWTALFTCVILRKAQTAVKMAGIFLCVAGLTLPTLDSADDGEDAQGQVVFLGIMLTFVGTLFYALEYTLCERAFTLYDRPVDAKELCFQTGAWGFLFTATWMCAYTLPHWSTLVTDELAEAHDGAGGSVALCLFLFATHTLNNAVHNAAWFVVCELESGVSTGLLMGVKAAALFLASALFFCDAAHKEQCMTPLKSGATAIVLVGTAVYYWPGDLSADCARWRARGAAPRRAALLDEHSRTADDPALPAEPESPLPRAKLDLKLDPRRRRRRKGQHARLENEDDSDDEVADDGADDEQTGEEEARTAVAADAAASDDGDADGDGRANGVPSGGGGGVPVSAAQTPATACKHAAAVDRASPCASATNGPRINGTPLPLGTPNDECCRTPLEPTSAPASRPVDLD